MLSTNVKGAIAEQAIALAAVRLHVPVWRPASEHSRADLVLEIGGRLLRVQCKWGRLSPDGNAVVVRVGTSRHSPNGYIRTTYSAHEVELFGIYAGDLNRCFLVPVSVCAGKHQVHLRLRPARNGQKSCITLADDFDFAGAIAQLGERSAGSRKVAGSNPASSTPRERPVIATGYDDFRVRLAYWLD